MRIQSLDLARGFTVFIMPAVHVVMLYSNTATQQSMMGNILEFLAEGPGAQLFMMLMGISMTLSKRLTKKTVLRRTLLLLVAGYALNFLKFVVPLGLHISPAHLLSELGFHTDREAMLPLLLMGDILQFAAIVYPLLYFVYTLPLYHYWALLLAVILAFLSPTLWDVHSGVPGVDYMLQLFGGHPPQVFFPVFPWIIYPLAGLVIGYRLKRKPHAIVFEDLGILGVALLILAAWLPHHPTPVSWLPFYRTGAIGTIYHTGIVLVWLYLCQWVTVNVRQQYFFRLLHFLSRNITGVYLIQWILVAWILPFAGYHDQGMDTTVGYVLMISATSFYLTHLFDYFYGTKNI